VAGSPCPEQRITVPTLSVCGADDGCALPGLADGQEALFTGDHATQVQDGTGHFPHLERPERTAEAVLGRLTAHPATPVA
jgi:pimeloyl-ACP methyl ester carboxylesterase